MRRATIYLLVFASLLGVGFYYHLSFGLKHKAIYEYQNQQLSAQKYIQQKDYLDILIQYDDSLFSRWPKITYTKDDFYVLYDTLFGSISLIEIAVDGSENDSLFIFEKTLSVPDLGDLSFWNINWQQVVWDQHLDDFPVTKISKQKFKSLLLETPMTYARVFKEKRVHDSTEDLILFSPFSSVVLLILLVLIFWFADSIATLFEQIIKVKSKITKGFIIILGCVAFFGFAYLQMYSEILSEHIEIPSSYKINILVLVLIIPLLVFFFYLKDKFFNTLSFGDSEAAKFMYLFIGVLLWTLIFGYFNAKNLVYLNDERTFSDFWPSIQFPAIAIFFASANFLNNFRKHYFSLKGKEKLLETSKQKETEATSELAAIQARVNPHFLYNSLNSIASLAKENPIKTEEMAIALSDFYKYNVNRKEQSKTKLVSEFEMLENYLKIEKIRFGNRLEAVLRLDDDILDFKVPRFILQPLVENAIKYGFDAETNKIKIVVRASRQVDKVHLSVLDTGKPFNEKMNIGFGIQSIQQKLKLEYPSQHQFIFENKPQKRVLIILNVK